MTDKQRTEILSDFINTHSSAIGGDIAVIINDFSTSFKPINGRTTMRHEDVLYLEKVLDGATQLLYFLERQNKTIKPIRAKVSK